MRQSVYDGQLADLLTRGSEKRANLLNTRQTLTLQRYHELGELRNEFMEKSNWNNYDVVMRLRPKCKKERPNNDAFIKGM